MTQFLSESQAKKTVVEAGKQLVASGLIARTWGNVSCRISERHFVITPSGRDYLSLTEEEIVKVAIEDLSYEGDIKPSGEKAVHAEIYQQKPQATFVIHTHQEKASVVGTLDIESIPVNHQQSFFGQEIRCAHYGLPGTKRLRKNVGKALANTSGQAVIMKSHGALCFGKDYQEAFFVASELEERCQAFLDKTTRFMTQAEREEDRMRGLVAKITQRSYDALIESNVYKGPHSQIKVIVNRIKEAYEGNEVAVLDKGLFKDYALLNQALSPLLDDFAQIVGVKVKSFDAQEVDQVIKALKTSSAVFIRGFGLISRGMNQGDLQAIEMIVHKNIEAQLYGELLHSQAKISWLDSQLMRWVYLKKYSKQI